MSVENVVSRNTRDVEAAAEQPATFQLPPELASQYQVRVIEPSDGSERRVGMFLPKDRNMPSIEIGGNGDRIVARNENPATIAALVKIASHNGWEGIDVDGSLTFRKAVWVAASREGMTVEGYEPTFGEQAKMERHRADAARRNKEATEASVPAQAAPKSAPEASTATIAHRLVDDGREAPTQDRTPASNGIELSDGDHRLLLGLSSLLQDRKTLAEPLHEGMTPMARELQDERLDRNQAVLGNALEWALESPTLVMAFTAFGYKPDDLRRMAREWASDGELTEAVQRVLAERKPHDVAKDAPGMTAADDVATDREDRPVVEPTRTPEPTSGPQTVSRERLHDAAAERGHKGEELAELFLHGVAAQILAEPRLSNALEAQAAMERHLDHAFDGDAIRVTTATFESRQMISDVLRRGLDISLRMPTPAQQIASPQHTPDLER